MELIDKRINDVMVDEINQVLTVLAQYPELISRDKLKSFSHALLDSMERKAKAQISKTVNDLKEQAVGYVDAFDEYQPDPLKIRNKYPEAN